jgi:precorrin-6B C5,15-methyltransferase / cobalt-precorrin-6B C5,C15-methyltransferase
VTGPGTGPALHPDVAADGLPPVAVVGMVGGEVFGAGARAALAAADLLVGSVRHLDRGGPSAARKIELTTPLDTVVAQIRDGRADGARVCVLASGDPGFFGIARLLTDRFPAGAVEIHPAPSSVALACARAGVTWDDAVVVSAHGRPLADAVDVARRHDKVVMLTSPDHPPQAVGRALTDVGYAAHTAVVASRMGEPDEMVTRTDLQGLATGDFDPMSVVVLLAVVPDDADDKADDAPSLAWGRPTDAYLHRAGMITKPETRAVALAKLDLPRSGVLWDLGAGSGSVGIEAATLSPGLHVVAVERNPEDCARITANAHAGGRGNRLTVGEGEAPAVLGTLPDPDRVFLGGGGIDVLDVARARLRPGGTLVATFVLLDRAVQAHERLGSMVQLHVDRAVPIGGAGVRLEPANPVFICWGR